MQIPPQYCRKKDRKQKRMLSKNVIFAPLLTPALPKRYVWPPPNSHNNDPKPIIRSKKGIHTQRCRLPPCVCERSARPLL
ncbi:hypothetical protein M9X92_004073 [Pyricularia oryzae]|nr:hypothetical protein M9X92_004073 [Pyricularia oryzae]